MKKRCRKKLCNDSSVHLVCAKTRLEISAAICTKILLTALFIPSIACIIVKYDEKPVNKKIALPAIRAYSLNARVLVTRQLSTIFTPIKVFLVCILDSWRCTTSVTARSLQEAPSVKLYIRVFTPTILETKPFFVLFFFLGEVERGGSRTSLAAADWENTRNARIGVQASTPTLADLCQLGRDDSASRVFLCFRVLLSVVASHFNARATGALPAHSKICRAHGVGIAIKYTFDSRVPNEPAHFFARFAVDGYQKQQKKKTNEALLSVRFHYMKCATWWSSKSWFIDNERCADNLCFGSYIVNWCTQTCKTFL